MMQHTCTADILLRPRPLPASDVLPVEGPVNLWEQAPPSHVGGGWAAMLVRADGGWERRRHDDD
jgi:hypothetical protein